MNNIKNYIWMGAIVVVLIGLMVWSVKGTATIEPAFSVDTIHPLDYVKGNASSTVLIIEYSDFQCPACRVYYFVMKELMAEFGGEVALVYRHFPLITIHPNAEFAARAAEAAGKQGKFWEMHDLLFEKQDEWSKVSDIQPLFESYAKLLGISTEQFRADWTSPEVKNLVKAQRMNALKLGLPGTPSLFINGEQIQNPNSMDAFRAIIKDALAKK